MIIINIIVYYLQKLKYLDINLPTFEVSCIATAMTDSISPHTKKFNTELTDYSTRHTENSGPYAVDLDIDAIIVGAGFGMLSINNFRLE